MESILKSIEEGADGLMDMKRGIDKAIDGIVDEVETFLTDERFEGRKTRPMHAELTRYAVSTLKKKLDDADYAVQDDE